MSPKLLASTHAEDVGSAVVEPGQPIPDDADQSVVSRLEAEGKISDVKSSRKSSKEG
jgi:hypothetical protein